MFKIIAFSFNLIALVFFNLLVENVTIKQSVPNRVEEGNEFVVTVTIDKSQLEGYAKFQVVLPPGVTASAIDTGSYKFNFESNKAKFVWMELPTEPLFTISYKVTINDSSIKELNLAGTFSYIDENERMTADLPTQTVFIGEKEEIVVEEVPNAEISIKRTIENIALNQYKVSLNIHYNNVTGFAKIQDQVPYKSDIKPDVASDAVFTIIDTKVKFVWMNFPEDRNDISVSYFIDLTNSPNKEINNLTGQFAYIHDGASQKKKIENTGATINIRDEEPLAATSQPIHPVKETKKASEKQTIKSVKTTPKSTPKKTVSSPSQNIAITQTPEPENGVIFKVQVMAAKRSINITKYFSKTFNYNGKIQVDSHDGWMKYLTGGFDNYLSARNLRESHKQGYSFKGPFVVAYNNGDRISVQEALMITNQNWIN